jgi:hypothetical protein
MGVDLEYGKGATCAANGYLRFLISNVSLIRKIKFKLYEFVCIASIQIDTYQLSKTNWRDNMSMKKQTNFLFTRPKELLLMGA